MAAKRVSGNFFNDLKRLLMWGGGKAKNRLKGKGGGLLHRILEAMRR